MAKKGAREIVALICTVCKNQNYITTRNKINMETKGKKVQNWNLKSIAVLAERYNSTKKPQN